MFSFSNVVERVYNNTHTVFWLKIKLKSVLTVFEIFFYGLSKNVIFNITNVIFNLIIKNKNANSKTGFSEKQQIF